ncbi:Hypothetical_protein [Hexamita inflata]|uniref:Hypothetical_protein n=1 Tax=Hexamita inflata TaxID=28002 RepID=A0AA86RM66_9EUKA|nr:Hypothetical protein HINF_LOCUS10561 [Hexamita inflata]CAI9974429.1 Hypothetical protein HINF_LOCUS62074 [Hexamita inflata]CAI9974432.1 Hypothetical protein HINF_LOCUS62077 [Hexamita inflata]CAI9974434.1 Hypothetical protein HINF_LOCUS62079 [Hexamita inflata]
MNYLIFPSLLRQTLAPRVFQNRQFNSTSCTCNTQMTTHKLKCMQYEKTGCVQINLKRETVFQIIIANPANGTLQLKYVLDQIFHCAQKLGLLTQNRSVGVLGL